LGHLKLAKEILKKWKLDEVWFLPAAMSPHKQHVPTSSFDHRFNMCQLAIEGDPFFKVLDIESKRPPPSYTIDTLKQLLPQFPQDQFFWILGEKSVNDFFKWRAPEEIVALVNVVVGSEKKSPPKLQGDPAILSAIKRGWTEMGILKISGTEVRRRVRDNLDISLLVPPKIVDYIHRNNLY
jgi:nicotinate-nucleotide adenylyltransferase